LAVLGEVLTVIDFIGNYANNYFDEIARSRIFDEFYSRGLLLQNVLMKLLCFLY